MLLSDPRTVLPQWKESKLWAQRNTDWTSIVPFTRNNKLFVGQLTKLFEI